LAGRIEWLQADLGTQPPKEDFDLVCSHYVHAAAGPAALLENLAAAVAPGGTLLMVGHHPDDAHHAQDPGAHFTAEQAAAGLEPDRWEVLTAETATREAAHGRNGPIVLTDTVLCARRRR
ncbi:SAM-dependent methyltransferase, partial [Streptomonospora algeriensis]